ncbi:MAG: MarR family transcriptional regulator [Clostridia bacterium]|nr:MarR family transcriptional regulator [Clostridia bacterium]
MKDFSKEFNKILAETYHNVLLAEETKRKYSKAGFTFRDRNAISYLTRFKNGTNLSDVADFLKISRPSTTTLIKKLEAHGLVERVPDPTSDRGTLVKITRKGRLFAIYQQRYRDRMAARVSDEMTETEMEILYKSFCKLNQFFVDSINESEEIHK